MSWAPGKSVSIVIPRGSDPLGTGIERLRFADGTTLAIGALLALAPPAPPPDTVQGTSGPDLLQAGPEGAALLGHESDDVLLGDAGGDLLAGGDGDDGLDGGRGADRYVFSAGETGIDAVADSGANALAWLDRYYGERGIAWRWAPEFTHPGRWRIYRDLQRGYEYFATYEEAAQAAAADRGQSVSFVAPPSSLPTLVRRDDTAALRELAAAGVIEKDVIEFGPGIALSDLTLTGVVTVAPQGRGAERSPWRDGGTLRVRWRNGAAGFDLQVPDAYYGFAGENLVAGGDPGHTGASGSWRGYALGEGIEAFRFSDGTEVWVEELLALAPLEIYGSEGDDLLEATPHADVIHALGGNDSVFAGDGADRVDGGDGEDALAGGAGDDELRGGDGEDTLTGGAGDDYLAGGAGNDLYLCARGDGRDEIWDRDETPGNVDVLRFGPGITTADVRVTRAGDTLFLVLGEGADRIALAGALGDPANAVERVEFADGTVWAASELASRVELLPATGLGDILWGSEAADAIAGLAGADDIFGNGGDDFLDGGEDGDSLSGGAGNDLLYGGAGDDSLQDGEGANLLSGGAGDDTLSLASLGFAIGGAGDDWIEARAAGAVIAFNRGEGNDTIYALVPFTLSLGGGIAPADLVMSRVDSRFVPGARDLFLQTGGGDSIRLSRQWESDWSAWPAITLQLFGSVHRYDLRAVIAAFEQAAQGDPAFSLALGESLERNRTATSETEALGGALAWQYAHAGNLEGLGEEQMRGVLSQPGFGTQPQPIGAAPAPNRAPVVARAPAEVFITAGSPFAFALAPDTFSDPDAGDALVYSAAGAGGGSLPGWLSFDAAGLGFSGSAPASAIGAVPIAVTATDRAGAQAAAVLNLAVRASQGTTVTGDRGDNVLYGNSGAETLVGRAGNDYLAGFEGDDLLRGGAGNDLLQGGQGNDVLHAGSGRNLLDGGAGDDVIHGGRGGGLIIGGAGNDLIRTGRGRDVIAFNRGDGQDVIWSDREGDNTLSLGGGIRYEDLRFRKSGRDLVLELGGSDSITFKNWYGGQGRTSLLNLQIVTEAMAGFDDSAADPMRGARVNVFDARGL
ncbi:MAG: putative Ig domain-containing protein, partial [Elioraea sp.]|nr:putative Ig domain-containing protein [Elioraea sp.]